MEYPSKYIDVLVDCASWNCFDYSYLENIAFEIFKYFNYHEYLFELCLYLTDNDKIQKLNLEYRNKNKPTNVLSFERGLAFSKEHTVLIGDIVIAHEYSLQESKTLNIPFKDHISHLFIHGMLHLLGYDHIHDEDFIKMKELEILFLKQLNIKNPYEE